jgi:phage/conjugal plasmid C-4 type zinc finger TraR family protein
LADDADKAQLLTESEAESGINRVRAEVNGIGQEFCEDCECEIPAARRIAYPAAIRCTPCQTDHEKLQRLYG